MSIDKAAEPTPSRGEKDVVRSLASTGRPDQSTVGSAMEKLARMGEMGQSRVGVASAVPDPIKADMVADRPVLQATKQGPRVTFPVTLPDDLVFHCVQPYELDSLSHLARPVSLAVASIATGCALGMIPLVHGALDAVNDLSKINNVAMLWYLIYAMTFALTSGIALIAWVNAIRGGRDARRLLRDIRQRPNVPLSQIVK